MESAHPKKQEIILAVNGGEYLLLYIWETIGKNKARQAPGFSDIVLFFFRGFL